ncbi:MAG: Diacylglycerol kinase, partial [uncultured Lysobacter sp.]
GGRIRPPAARPGAHAESHPMVAAGAGRRVDARILVPAGGLPVHRHGPAGVVAGADAGGTRAAGRLAAAGAGHRTAELGDRGGHRALRRRIPRARRPREGHGIGRGADVHAQRAADLGRDPRAPAVRRM